ncbi:hypothetical protein [Streptomyces hirsutus]|uniref:hypothetical protein n=1 Tax=Streptomyces hirsutus TaxID=35620 RepID=UPI0033256B0F
MADVWVKRQTPHNVTRTYENGLIRADSINRLEANNRAVVASQLDAEEPYEIACPQIGKPLPEGFHLAFLAALSTTRFRARGSDEDLVLVAEHAEDTWRWSTYTASELWNS